ncbi:MAG: EpsG family protein [Myroides sp.]|nr:EpsG family protein [Myroides sp.]
MEDILFIQEYYYYLIAFICLLIVICFTSYLSRYKLWSKTINVLVVVFSFFTAYYIGSRPVYIGVDTGRYEQTFLLYKNTGSFFIRKDLFFDFLNYSFSRLFDFQSFLFLCAFIYVFGVLYGLKKIFKVNYYLPFLVFLISPYFINNGINVMRSGIATSIFIAGIGMFYSKAKPWKWISLLAISVLFHFSLFVPLMFFAITRYFNRTIIIFLVWLFSILLSVLNINIIASLITSFEFIAARGGAYVDTSEEQNSWVNFFIFGFFPVAFGVYNTLVLKYKDSFYKWILNAYMLAHIPYIILISSQYASRLGFLAEFMMPIILMYPLLINPVIKIKYYRLKLSILIFCVFMVKAYKILIV